MKFASRYLRLRLLATLLGLVLVAAGVVTALHASLLAGGVRSLAVSAAPPKDALAELAGILDLYGSLGLVLAAAGAVLALALLVTMHRGRLGTYRTIVRKLTAVNRDRTRFTLDSISFPNEDDLGNLGETINSILARLREFENLRRDELLLSDDLVRAAIACCEHPLAVFDEQFVLLCANEAFTGRFGDAAPGTRGQELLPDPQSGHDILTALRLGINSQLKRRTSADPLVPAECQPLIRPGLAAKRVLVRFAAPAGE